MKANFNNPYNNGRTNSDMIRQAVTTAALVGSVAYMTKVGVANKLADKFDKTLTHKAAQNVNKKFAPKIAHMKKVFSNKLNSITSGIVEKAHIVKNVIVKYNPVSKVIGFTKELITKIRKK